MKKIRNKLVAALAMTTMVGVVPLVAMSDTAGANPILLYVTYGATNVNTLKDGCKTIVWTYTYWTDHWVGGSTTSGVNTTETITGDVGCQ